MLESKKPRLCTFRIGSTPVSEKIVCVESKSDISVDQFLDLYRRSWELTHLPRDDTQVSKHHAVVVGERLGQKAPFAA